MNSINLEDDGTTDPEKTSPLVIGFGLMYHFMMPSWGNTHGLIGGWSYQYDTSSIAYYLNFF